MLEICNLSYRYPSGTEALKNVSMTLPPRQISSVLGESGSGKTTLLMCLGRFLQPSSGKILQNGKDIQTMPEKAFRQQLGIVFQKLNLFPHLTVLENLILAPVQAYGQQPEEAMKEGWAILERLGISDLAESYPSQISGGQAQRVAIARGLILKPEYLLLDEPTSALDANTTGDFAEWLTHLQEQTHFVVVTHDLEFAKAVATEGFLLAHGELKASGPIDSVVEQGFGSQET